MGQREVYEALDALGGRATLEDWRRKFYELYPESERLKNSHFRLMVNRLNGNYISFEPKTETYFITGYFPERNIVGVIRV